MYSDIEIETLSKNQVSKLLNGHPVRLMVGVGHTIGVSSEQYKKLMKAKNKGSSVTITLDPYQIDESQHLRDDVRGSGVRKSVKSIIPDLKKVVRKRGSGVKQISLKQLAKMNNEILNQNVDEGNDVNVVSFEGDIEGEGIKDFVGMLKRKKVGRKFVIGSCDRCLWTVGQSFKRGKFSHAMGRIRFFMRGANGSGTHDSRF